MDIKKNLTLILIIILSSDIISEVILSDHEKNWLQNHPVITLGVDKHFKPMNYTDEKDELKGLNIDMLKLVEKKIGYKFKYYRATWAEVLSMAMSGKIDGIINADKTPDREKVLNFTDVLAHHPIAIYVNKRRGLDVTLENIAGKKIGVKESSTTYKLLKNKYPDLEVISFKSTNEALFSLMSNKIDGVCDWQTILSYTVKEHFLTEIVPSSIFLAENLGRSRIGVKKEYPELLYILNRAIADISSEEKDSLFNKWIQTSYDEKQVNLSFLWKVLLLIILILTAYTFWNLKLSKEIKKRNLTEYKLEETIGKLRKSEERSNIISDRLGIALMSSKAGIWDYDLIQNVIIWDERMYELYGIKKDDFNNDFEAWQKGIYPDDLERTTREIKEAVHEHKTFDTVFRVLWPDNSIHFIKANAELKYDNEGTPIRMVGVNFDITDQKHAEEKVLLSEKRLRQVQHIAGIGYWDLDIKLGKLEWSEEVFKIFGMQKNNKPMLLQDFVNRIHPDDKNMVMKLYQDSIDNKSKYEVMHRIVQEDVGDIRYVVEHCEHSYNEEGDAIRSLGTIHDITDQILLEEEKKKFFDMSQDFIGIAEFNAHFRFVNKAFVDALGYSEKELKEKTFFDFIHPDDHKKTGEAMSALLKGDSITDFENRYITKNGDVRWLSWRSSPDLEKGFIYYIARDITYSKMAENELRKNREQLRTIIDSVNSLIFMKDVNGYFLIVNKAYERTVGISSVDVLGKTEYDIFPDEIATMIVEKDKEIIRNRDEVTYEEDITLKDGLIHNFITTKVPLFNDDGTVYGLVGMAVDITGRKKMEQELLHAKNVAEESYRAKSEFLANMSHEIRTPLNAVTGFSELLSTMVTDEKQKSYLSSIKTAGKALLHLINDVLDLSKLEAGKLLLNTEYFNIRNLLNEISDIFHLDIKRKGIDFKVKVSPLCPDLIKLDIGRLRQILLNLIGNAVKFTSEGYIRISVEVEDDIKDSGINIAIKIKDSGIGISTKDQENIFENFRQQAGQDTRKYGGTGLGLSICKKLAELMDGKISVKSEIGKGAEFIVVIPVKEFKSKKELDSINNDNQMISVNNLRFENRTVWVVDDTDSSRKLVEEMLGNVGINFRSFRSGKELLNSLTNKNKPSLIISDIRMPELNGIELLQKVREKYDENVIPVIALSATGSSEIRDSLLEIKFNAFLKKPLKLADFYNKLGNFIPIMSSSDDKNEEQFDEVIDSDLFIYLKEDFYKSICTLKGGVKVNEVMKIGENLLNTALKYNSEQISTFAQKIIDAADGMDIIYLKSLKEKTERLLENIKGGINV